MVDFFNQSESNMTNFKLVFNYLDRLFQTDSLVEQTLFQAVLKTARSEPISKKKSNTDEVPSFIVRKNSGNSNYL